jgi:hypothetical protein
MLLKSSLFPESVAEAINTLEAGGSYVVHRKTLTPAENLTVLLVQRYSESMQMQSAKSMETKPLPILVFYRMFYRSLVIWHVRMYAEKEKIF